MTKYAPRLPIIINDKDKNNDFIYIEEAIPNVRQDLKMLLLTNPGEKLMDPNFGVGVRRYLFELQNGVIDTRVDNGTKSFFIKDLKNELSQRIINQVNSYMPQITINSIETTDVDKSLYLTINFSYLGFFTDIFTIN